ncbi:MAG: aminotransferase class III-fold pyridoxal phosphate-dependent enzyme [Dehalococcoidia bacterium]
MNRLSPRLRQATGVTAVRGEGVFLYGDDDRQYLDFTSGIGVTSTGHCHPRVVEALQRQAAQLIHGQYTTVLHPGLIELSERLSDLMPAPIDSLFFVNAGSEAVEAALRLVRQATVRPNVVVFHGSFHGRTMGALSLTTSRVALRAGLQPMMGGVVVAPFPYAYRYGWDEQTTVEFCLRELDHIFHTVTAPDETAAMFIEPVLGEGGYVPVPATFMQGLRERCDRYGMLLVVDEIQTGIGRTGRFWGYEHTEVEPDVIITAKGLASGMPLSAVGASDELMEATRPGSQGGTYGGNALSCAAALATLDVVEEEGLVRNAADQGAYALGQLREIASNTPRIGEVRGQGLMLGIEFITEDGAPDGQLVNQVTAECEARGLLVLTCGSYGQVVRLIPPLIVTREQMDDGLARFADAVTAAVGAAV